MFRLYTSKHKLRLTLTAAMQLSQSGGEGGKSRDFFYERSRNFLPNQNTGIPYMKLILITIPGRAICKENIELIMNVLDLYYIKYTFSTRLTNNTVEKQVDLDIICLHSSWSYYTVLL